jgi:hypothetical protein
MTEDPVRLGRAYNNSIYLMAGMPYLCLGTVGFLIYRRFRLHGTDQQPVPGLAHPLPPGDNLSTVSPGDQTCSLPSRAGDS